MSQYGLKRYTLLPSLYSESNFWESNPITIVDSENDCHVAITKKARLHTSQGCTVIAFFMGSAELEKYLATSYKITLSQWSMLREGQSLSHKAQTIKGAATDRHERVNATPGAHRQTGKGWHFKHGAVRCRAAKRGG